MRAKTVERGYGTSHRRERARVAKLVEAGGAVCAGCGRLIVPGSAWHLGHAHQSGGYAGPEHARCNVADRNRRHGRKRRIESRVW